jgi:hypothetical protein
VSVCPTVRRMKSWSGWTRLFGGEIASILCPQSEFRFADPFPVRGHLYEDSPPTTDDDRGGGTSWLMRVKLTRTCLLDAIAFKSAEPSPAPHPRLITGCDREFPLFTRLSTPSRSWGMSEALMETP